MDEQRSEPIKKRMMRRPTEEKALAAITREAMRRGMSQSELLNRNITLFSHDSNNCTCLFCRRRLLLMEN